MRLLPGLLCAALAFAQDDEEILEQPEPAVPREEVAEGPSLEEVTRADVGQLLRGEREGPAVLVRLRPEGRLQVREGDDWEDVSLDGPSAALRAACRAYVEEQARRGEPAYEDRGCGWYRGKVCRLFVALDVAPDVPWRHVQWVLTVAAEEHLTRLELSDGNRRLLALLPQDKSHLYEPPARVRAPVRLLHGAGGAVRVRFGDVEAQGCDGLAKWIDRRKRGVKQAELTDAVGEIRADPAVPFERVLEVMALFVDGGVTVVDYEAVAIPAPALRGRPRLPEPGSAGDRPLRPPPAKDD